MTEEMLVELERQADFARRTGDNGYPEGDVEALVAEVRRLRAAQSTWLGLAEAHAAGYARAERDVVAWLRHQAEEHGKLSIAAFRAGLNKSSESHASSAVSVSMDANAIEQGAHRGAAKDEAPRGEGDGR